MDGEEHDVTGLEFDGVPKVLLTEGSVVVMFVWVATLHWRFYRDTQTGKTRLGELVSTTLNTYANSGRVWYFMTSVHVCTNRRGDVCYADSVVMFVTKLSLEQTPHTAHLMTGTVKTTRGGSWLPLTVGLDDGGRHSLWVRVILDVTHNLILMSLVSKNWRIRLEGSHRSHHHTVTGGEPVLVSLGKPFQTVECGGLETLDVELVSPRRFWWCVEVHPKYLYESEYTFSLITG